MSPKLDQERSDKIFEYYTSGKKVSEIARKLDITDTTVRNNIKLHEIKNPETGEGFETLSDLFIYLRGSKQIIPKKIEKENKPKLVSDITPHSKDLSDLIEIELNASKSNQSKLAKSCGVSRQSINSYISGAYFPNYGILSRMFSSFNVKVNEDFIQKYPALSEKFLCYQIQERLPEQVSNFSKIYEKHMPLLKEIVSNPKLKKLCKRLLYSIERTYIEKKDN
jgi:DNA-binding XRE family transcriptional regulator